MTEYQPPQKGDALNEHVARHIGVLGIGSLIFGALWLILIIALDFIDPTTSIGRQLRYQFAKCSASIIGVGVLLWLLIYVEIVINGSILGRLVHDALALAIFCSALILVAGGIYIYV